MRILLIEDDRMLAKLMRLILVEDGYAVDVAGTGQEGQTLAAVNPYDLVLLDLNLPDMSGLQVLQSLRRAGNTTAIVIITAQGSEADVVRGLDAGADDYVVKPVPNDILRSRVRAAIRRGGAKRTEQVAVGDLVLNRLTREIRHAGTRLALTPREFALLEHLMLHAGEVVTRTQLLERVWDMHFDPGSNVVEVHVSRLREKLRPCAESVQLRTVRGAGFMLAATAPVAG